MATILLSIILFAVVMAGMAVGLICQGKTIKGSCGGISALGMGTACDICGGDTRKCEKEDIPAKQATAQGNNPGQGNTKGGGFYEA